MSQRSMAPTKRICLIAHDNLKDSMLEWAHYNRGTLARHALFATGTTGALLEQELGLEVSRFASGPLGGDQQVGAAIVEDRLDLLVFLWDPLEPHPHDVDVKALLRVAVAYNIPVACNRATADFLLSSPLLDGTYDRDVLSTSQMATASSEARRVARRSEGGERSGLGGRA